MKRRILMHLLGACLVLLGTPQVWADEYTVVVRAIKGIDQARMTWQPTVDALNEKIPAHRFHLQPIVSLQELVRHGREGRFDFVLTNPSSFVELQQRHGARALATLINKRQGSAQTRFGTVIFVRADRDDILDLQDLKGKTLMAVSEPAFGGWRVGWLELLEQGIDPYRDLRQLRFAGGIQPKVVEAVLKGEADAGVVRTDMLEGLAERDKIDMRYFRVLNNKDVRSFPFFLSTALYPEWPLAAMAGVPDAVTEAVGKALLSIRHDSRAAQQGDYVGWMSPQDYGSVKRLMQRLQVGPYAQQ
jgi:ABC-type phosphate/phosphonate transport system substrate-binding protein